MSEIPFEHLFEHLKVEPWPPRPRGGQHVGGGPNGVKVTHLPSGTEAFVEIGRSQHINRMIALEMILAAVTHPRMPDGLPAPPQLSSNRKDGGGDE